MPVYDADQGDKGRVFNEDGEEILDCLYCNTDTGEYIALIPDEVRGGMKRVKRKAQRLVFYREQTDDA